MYTEGALSKCLNSKWNGKLEKKNGLNLSRPLEILASTVCSSHIHRVNRLYYELGYMRHDVHTSASATHVGAVNK